MKINELPLSPYKPRKRVGRGIASGYGKTAGRGTKGQRARSGVSLRPGFEGGQNPLLKRIPKQPGFTSRKQPAQRIYTGQLNRFGKRKTTVTLHALHEAGLIAHPRRRTKLLVRGKVTAPVSVEVHEASQQAQQDLKKAGGSVKLLGSQPKRTKQVKDAS